MTTTIDLPDVEVHARVTGDSARINVVQMADSPEGRRPRFGYEAEVTVWSRSYGVDGYEVTVGQSSIMAQAPAEAALRAAIYGEAAAIGATIERLIAVEGMTVDLAVRTVCGSPRFPFKWTLA